MGMPAPVPVTAAPATQTNSNQYDSILQMVEAQNKELAAIKAENQVLSKKVAAASGDISKEVKEATRIYGYGFDKKRIPEEMFKFGYRVLMHDDKEKGMKDKVVVNSVTKGRPVNFRNENTGKWTNVHNVEITFHDGTKTEMDVLDYLNQFITVQDFVADEDIVKGIDGKNYYTFRTEKFGTFTLAENFIN